MVDVELAERLRASMGALVRAARARPDAMPEHRAQTLGFLLREGALTTAELAERRRVRHQTMQAAVTELEQDGLVERSPDPRDQRARLVGLTAAGRTALATELERRSTLLAAAIDAQLDAGEQQALARVPAMLDRIAAYVATEEAVG